MSTTTRQLETPVGIGEGLRARNGAGEGAAPLPPVQRTVELSDAEKEAFRAKMGPVYDLVKRKAGEDIVNKVLEATR